MHIDVLNEGPLFRGIGISGYNGLLYAFSTARFSHVLDLLLEVLRAEEIIGYSYSTIYSPVIDELIFQPAIRSNL
ncbi:hypothetical protein KTGMC3_P1669 [Methanocalculus sp. MC3]